jgi:uncharacterized protein YggL (DUF469 family)
MQRKSRMGTNYRKMKIAEYRTATGQTVEQLDASVNRFIKDCYQPYGVPYYAGPHSQDGSALVCQAMIKVSELQQQKPKLETA